MIAYSVIPVEDTTAATRAVVAAEGLDPPKGWRCDVTSPLVGFGRVWRAAR